MTPTPLSTIEMALQRTLMASERTLMAWMRTAVSMIGLGFTLYKFLEYMRQQGVALQTRPQGPRNLGLALIGLGAVSLLVGGVRHWHLRRRLGKTTALRAWDFALTAAAIVVLTGVLAFWSILMHVGPF